MDILERVEAYLASQTEPKQTELRHLHEQVLAEFPDCRLWFNDGTNQDGKVVCTFSRTMLIAKAGQSVEEKVNY